MKEVRRPWGNFRQFALNKECTVKLLTIKPDEELSLQSHKNRAEEWYFLDKAVVQLGNRRFNAREGSFIHVKKNEKHRIIAQKNKVRLIEIAFGKFSEKDEKRFEDKYKRS